MVFTPSPMLLKLLYTRGSLHNLPQNAGVAFSIKNRLDTVRLTGFGRVQIGDVAGFRYEVQNLQGRPVRKGTCRPGQNDVAGMAAGLYLLVTTSPEGERQTRRVEVR